MLLLLRVLRPDRILHALADWIEDVPGLAGLLAPPDPRRRRDLERVIGSCASASMPLLINFTPGSIDPEPDIEALAAQSGFTNANGRFKSLMVGAEMETQLETALSSTYYLPTTYYLLLTND